MLKPYIIDFEHRMFKNKPVCKIGFKLKHSYQNGKKIRYISYPYPEFSWKK